MVTYIFFVYLLNCPAFSDEGEHSASSFESDKIDLPHLFFVTTGLLLFHINKKAFAASVDPNQP